MEIEKRKSSLHWLFLVLFCAFFEKWSIFVDFDQLLGAAHTQKLVELLKSLNKV